MGTMEDQDLSPQEIVAAYRAELERVYSRAYAQACILDYAYGWYYISHPVERLGDYEVNPIARPHRKTEVLKMLAALRES